MGAGVDFTFTFLVADNAGAPVGTLTLRGTATLEAVGQRLSATYTLTFADPAGHVAGTAPGTFRGARLTVAPAGTPVT